MAEQRLIDANELPRCEVHTVFSGKEYISVADVPYSQIESAKTIDPETLPVVCQLRAELDNLRKEKRPMATLVKSPFGVCCSRCKTECSPKWVACPVCGAEIKKEDAND